MSITQQALVATEPALTRSSRTLHSFGLPRGGAGSQLGCIIVVQAVLHTGSRQPASAGWQV